MVIVMIERSRKWMLTLALLLFMMAGSASAKDCGDGIAPCDCGDTVVADWKFTKDLICSQGHGLIIGTDGITIDGAGYKITGTGSAACGWISETDPSAGGCGIYNPGYDNVVIKNLEVKDFCSGIALHGTCQNPVEKNTIETCKIHHNGNATDGKSHGIHACFMKWCTVKNNDIHHNTGAGDACGDGGNGIFLYAGRKEYGGNVITKNELHDNRKGGFFTKMMLHNAEITENHAYRNGQGGIILRCKKSDENLIEDNNASGNYGDGIFIGGRNNTIRSNIVKNNMAGFRISSHDVVGDGDGIDMGRSDGSFDNKLYDNIICGNEGTDIDTFGPDSRTVGENNTCDTTNYYDDEGTRRCSHSCIDTTELVRELSSQGWVIYIINDCEWCNKQKEVFGDAFEYLNYVNCDEDETACVNAKIKKIPCWVSPNGTHYTGYQTLSRLSELADEYQGVVQPTASEEIHEPVSEAASDASSTPGFGLIPALIAIFFFVILMKKSG
ncbi:hypothetical protein DRN76_00490 [Methanosarcinales archaeon]|nr:MAG: hypothetical protein DRN76_00490 [Methanosarcinales archaeon]